MEWIGKVSIVFCAFCLWGHPLEAYADRASEQIDVLVERNLSRLNIPPSKVCSDEVFLRRVYLDVLGRIPTREECEQFLSSGTGNKRDALIEELLARPEFADYRAMKWCDRLRIKSEFPSNLWPNAVQAYYRWLHTALLKNMPLDEFARTLLVSSGSNFRVGPVNFYRALPRRNPEAISSAVALTFMGERTEDWSPEKQADMAAFFAKVGYKKTSEWKEEIVFFDPSIKTEASGTNGIIRTRFPDGTPAQIPPGTDPRKVFAEWLVHSDCFSRYMANAIWFDLMGRGIVHEPDDFRPDNPPENPVLLDFLAKELADNNYDAKHLYRIILESKTYQRSSIPMKGNEEDVAHFSHYLVRRVEAEVLIDMICQITLTTEQYSSRIPEPFTWIPKNKRAVELADGSITSPFLELFGRPSRDSGYFSERNNEPSAEQALHMLNSTHIQQKIWKNRALLGATFRGKGKNRKQKKAWLNNQKMLENAYLTILSRYPTDAEEMVIFYALNEKKVQRADVVWVLLNTREFVLKH